MTSRTNAGLSALLPLLFAVGLPACSGAADSGLFGPIPEDEISATDPGDSTGRAPSSPGGTSDDRRTPPSPPGRDDDGPKDPPKDPPPKEPPAPAACIKEKEPNDVRQRATPFQEAICGEIASGIDVDFLSVVAPENASKMKITRTDLGNRLSFRLYEDGDARTNNLAPTSTISIDGGATYTFRVATGVPGLDKPAYEIRVAFE